MAAGGARTGRHAVILTAAGVVLAGLGWFAWAALHQRTPQPAPSVETLLRGAADRFQPPGPDVTRVWLDAMRIATEVEAEGTVIAVERDLPYADGYEGVMVWDLDEDVYEPPTDATRAVLDELLARLRDEGFFERLDEAVAGRLHVAWTGDPYGAEASPSPGELRRLAHVLQAEFRRAHARGEHDRAAAAVVHLDQLATPIAAQGSTLYELTAAAFTSTALYHARELIRDAAVAESTLARLAAWLAEPARRVPRPDRLAVDRQLSHAALVTMHDANGVFIPDAVMEQWANTMVSNVPDFGHPFRRRAEAFFGPRLDTTRARLDRLYDEAVAACVPRPQRPLEFRDAADDVMDVVMGLPTADELLDPLHSVRSTLSSRLTIDDRARSDRAGTRVLVAIERFRRAHERWPDRLDELVPDWLPSIPIDPWTGERFRYRMLDDDSYELHSDRRDGRSGGEVMQFERE